MTRDAGKWYFWAGKSFSQDSLGSGHGTDCLAWHLEFFKLARVRGWTWIIFTLWIQQHKCFLKRKETFVCNKSLLNVIQKSSNFYNNKWEGWQFKVDFNASNRIMIWIILLQSAWVLDLSLSAKSKFQIWWRGDFSHFILHVNLLPSFLFTMNPN